VSRRWEEGVCVKLVPLNRTTWRRINLVVKVRLKVVGYSFCIRLERMRETSESFFRGVVNPGGVGKRCHAIADAGIGLQHYCSGILLGLSVTRFS
jgi:hypothetical protein